MPPHHKNNLKGPRTHTHARIFGEWQGQKSYQATTQGPETGTAGAPEPVPVRVRVRVPVADMKTNPFAHFPKMRKC